MKQLTVIGNLGADAELKVLNGRECVTFRVADTDSYTNSQGQKIENTVWYDCIMNNGGGNLAQYLVRGQRVYVTGLPSYRIYDSAKYHSKMVGVTISVRHCELLGGSSDPVPHFLADAAGNQIETFKFFYVFDEKLFGEVLHDKNMNEYEVDKSGIVSKRNVIV